ncbi:hypothetical protein [Spongiactinospora sp. TRM90649]|uniref:hypothetical protein n=1 Tax=Spongiactinospora sp. TRM90649 TaxID=3031114 RepID=UPI0023F6496B|nr:hypothetical protein [Spongiactinospora sp. TRM90649]MDF5757340.1 hypothetical protein [Spongiactinospora sp. TRM90649]
MGRRGGRRCDNCEFALPEGARASRRFCSGACRAEQWRKLRRSREVYAAAVAELAVLGIGRGPSAGELRAQRPKARCPVCGQWWWVGLRKRADAVYCSPRCRTAAWRERTGQVPAWLAELRARARP